MNRKAYRLVFKRSLKKTKSRFLSIFLIVFLGTAFFAGLRNTPITMKNSMNDYYKKHHFADLTLISSFGFTQEDIDSIEAIEGVKTVEGSYRGDVIFSSDVSSKEYNAIIHSQNQNFHDADILRGRNIENAGECLLDSRIEEVDLLGENIVIKNDYGEVTLKVVGIVNDARYISGLIRGTNSLTQASNDAFVIAGSEDIKKLTVPESLDELRQEDKLYNEILLSYDIDPNISLYDDEYDEVTRVIKANVTDMMQNRIINTKEEIVERYEAELAGPLQEYEDGLAEYNRNKDEFQQTINNAKIQLIEGKIQIIENKKELLEAQSLLNNETGNATDEIEALNQKIEEYRQQINAIPEVNIDLSNNSDTPEIDTDLPEVTLPDVDEITPDNIQQEAQAVVDQINQEVNGKLNELKSEVNTMTDELQTTLSGLKTLVEANVTINNASYELEKASLEVQKQEATLENLEIETQKQLDDAKIQLDDAKVQIDEAQQKIRDIPDGVLYSLSKDENAGYVSFASDTEAMNALSKIFPLMFFLVAALVSLTTMTRMVEEQRLQSGTLTALGYSKKDVMMLYVEYVLLATFFASLLGIAFGTVFFTNIIYFLYTYLMYRVTAPIHISLTPNIIPLTLFISVAVTLVVTIIVIYQELNSTPAQLLRPKPPKLGKRVLLEKINFIWKHLSFNQKVTVRNIFRYKKRFFMSIVGIAGCSALIVTGFGLKDSIAQIIPKQFHDVWTYDGSVALDESLNYDDIESLVDRVNAQYNIADSMGIYSSTVNTTSLSHSSDFSCTLMILSDRYNDLIHYYDLDKNELSLEDDSVILTQKASELLGIKKGDSISISIGEEKYNLVVSDICENYYQHYIYMSKTLYESLTGQQVEYNEIIFKMKDNDVSLEDSLETTLKQLDHIKSVNFMLATSSNFDTMIASINIVVVIIIIVAGLLAFVVLYNLTNINIQERMNEIATIKVLGFYPKEVYDYVFRENILLSVIGAFIGLIVGKVLHQFVIRTVEVDATMFYRQINITSYLYAIIITTIFTFLINRIMRRNVDKIDMVESLKSIE